MFRGIVETCIDAKGRTSLPAKFREVLADSNGEVRFFLTNSNPVRLGDGAACSGLAIYTCEAWLELEKNLVAGSNHNLTLAQLAAVKRTIMAPAVECSADKLGRILIPPHLRKNAALEREIIFAGMLNKAEIWSLAEWEKVRRQDDQNFPVDSPALAELGL
jgi:MraZ protein